MLPTETPFFTETPSPTATLTELPSATPLPTETMPELPSATTTEMALFTETPSVTPLSTQWGGAGGGETPSFTPAETLPADIMATETASPTPLPMEWGGVGGGDYEVVFAADFESPDLSAWTYDSGWGFHPVAAGQALRVYNSQTPFMLNQTYTDVAAEAQFIVDYAAAHLTVRQNTQSWYEVSLDASGFVTLYRLFEVVGQTLVAPSLPEQWRTVRLSAIGNLVTVQIDGIEILCYTDETPLPAGQISFHATFPPQPEGVVPVSPQNTLVVDNVVVATPGVMVIPKANTTNFDGTITMTPTETPEPLSFNNINEAPLQLMGQGSSLDEKIFNNVSTIDQLRNILKAANFVSDEPKTYCTQHTIINLSSQIFDVSAPQSEQSTVYTAYLDNTTSSLGLNAFPLIVCPTTINGNGATFQRIGTTPFRFFTVETKIITDSTVYYVSDVNRGNLTLKNLTLKDGLVTEYGGAGGGAVLGVGGIVALQNVLATTNEVDISSPFQHFGGGIYIFKGELTIESSTISNNNVWIGDNSSGSARGGGIAVLQSHITINNTCIKHNSSAQYAGALYVGGNASKSSIVVQNGFETNTTQSNQVQFDVVFDSENNVIATANWWNSASGPNTPGAETVNIAISQYRTTPISCSGGTPSPEQLATIFPLPMVAPSANNPVRLSDLDFDDRSNPSNPTLHICSRDINPFGLIGNYTIVSSGEGEVLIADTTLPNAQLGNFVAVRLPISLLKTEVVDALKQSINNTTVLALVNQKTGWLYIGMAHLQTVSVSQNSPIGAATPVGISGKTGLEQLTPTPQPHLDISVYYISGVLDNNIRSQLQINEAVGQYDPEPQVVGIDPAQTYSTFFKDTDRRYGLVELIDPLVIWPLLEEAQFSGQIDRTCP